MFKPLIASAQHHIEHASHHVAEHSHHGAEAFDFVAYILHSNIINMFFVAWFIVWIFKKFKIVSLIENKRDDITQVIMASEDEKEFSEQELKDAKKHVKSLDKEVREILLEAKNSAEAMYTKIKSDTKKRTDEIHTSLDKMIESEKKSASEKLAHNLTESAFEVAESHIKRSLNDEMHNKYIDNFIDSLDEKKVK